MKSIMAAIALATAIMVVFVARAITAPKPS